MQEGFLAHPKNRTSAAALGFSFPHLYLLGNLIFKYKQAGPAAPQSTWSGKRRGKPEGMCWVL